VIDRLFLIALCLILFACFSRDLSEENQIPFFPFFSDSILSPSAGSDDSQSLFARPPDYAELIRDSKRPFAKRYLVGWPTAMRDLSSGKILS